VKRHFRLMLAGLVMAMMLLTGNISLPSYFSRQDATISLAATQQNVGSTAILFQGFHWRSANYNGTWYQDLRSRAADLANLGVTHVWFPPPSDSAAKEGYLPRQLNVLNSAYGSEADLKSAISTLSTNGIKSVVDVVVNHRVGTTDWADFTNPSWAADSVVKGDEWPGATGAFDTGSGFNAGRDIDHTKVYVRDSIKQWLTQKLKPAGFSGLRLDYSKGYGASFVKEYHDAFAPDFCVGEIWNDLYYDNVNAHRQDIINWVNGTGATCGAFDFTTKGLLNKALSTGEYWRLRDSEGKPAGVIGWWAQKSITFVDNHDTGPSESCGVGQNHWPVPCDKVMEGYAYVLTHPGIPTIYYPHVYNWNLRAQIKALVDVRKSMGLNSISNVRIVRADQGLYAAIVNGNVAVKIGPNSWSPGTGWTLATSGTNYAVWKLTSGGGCAVPVTFSIANANTSLGQSLYVVGNQAGIGNWDPASGFKLTIQGSGANATWNGTVLLPAGTPIQFKFVKFDGTTAVWESTFTTTSTNREATTTGCSTTTTVNGGNFKF
jgi:alpha-amylase